MVQNLDASALEFTQATLDPKSEWVDITTADGWGRTGFDLGDAPEAACRGWFVGLVKNRTKKLIANEELALAA
jgi:beta-lactamase class D